MEETTFTVVTCSRDDQLTKQNFINHINETSGIQIKMIFITNAEGMSLTSIYHDIMTQVETNIVLFIHDDIEFLRPNWGVEVLRLFNTYQDYGIIGVAGSAEFDENGAWWNYNKKYGQVLHRHEGKCWVSAFSPLLEKDLEDVCVIDGLFIAVHKNRISSNFNKDIEGFHMYDIDFCLSNFLSHKCKIGVTTNIRIAHNSVGALSDAWFKNRDKINEKYGNYYPIKVKEKKTRK